MKVQTVYRGLHLVVATLLFAACSGAEAGVSDVVQRMGSCAQCAVEAVEVFATDRHDPHAQAAEYYLDHGGALWAFGGGLGGVLSYPLDGGPSRRDDRHGGGPGEFRRDVTQARAHPSGDSLVVAQMDRVDYFVTRGLALSYVRGFNTPVPVTGGLAVLADGSLVVSSAKRGTPTSAEDFALHHISATGEPLRSFRSVDSTFAGEALPVAASAGGSEVWVLMPAVGGFRVELWDPGEPARIRGFTVRPQWWYTPGMSPERVESELMAGRVRPNALKPRTSVESLLDAGSILWVVLRHADPGFMERDHRYSQPSISLDTVLLALDPVTGEVIAGTAFDWGPEGFTNLGQLVLHEDQDSGVPRLHVMDVALRRP